MKNSLTVCVLTFASHLIFAQPFSIEKSDEGAWIKDNGEKVLFYQAKEKSKNGKFPRADYVHPLFTPDGFELTEDFPDDHLHHRGIFWTWHQVVIGDMRMGDAWGCRDFAWDVREVRAGEKSKKGIALHTETLWKSPLWKDSDGNMKPFLEEKVRITTSTKTDNYRIIDFEISLLALEPDLKIGGSEDEKGYGGFSVRMKMPEDIKFNSPKGEVEPEVNQVEAGAWMDISGSMLPNGKKAGILIICHPENPMYPEKWILRKTGSMQNPVFPGRALVPISMTEPTILKYRLVVYSGQLTSSQISKLGKAY
jgi:hypothetical protein